MCAPGYMFGRSRSRMAALGNSWPTSMPCQSLLNCLKFEFFLFLSWSLILYFWHCNKKLYLALWDFQIFDLISFHIIFSRYYGRVMISFSSPITISMLNGSISNLWLPSPPPQCNFKKKETEKEAHGENWEWLPAKTKKIIRWFQKCSSLFFATSLGV